jgi:hypothetical protein
MVTMRKRVVSDSGRPGAAPLDEWLDLEPLATVEVTSEDGDHPAERAFSKHDEGPGWRAGEPGAQTLRLIFDQPQNLRRIWLRIREPETFRTQESVLRWSAGEGQPFREIVRQQWNFDPSGSTVEVEDYTVQLGGVAVLELSIVPDIGGREAFASVDRWRVA